MKKLNAMALSAALLPALSLGLVAFAAEDDDMQGDAQPGDADAEEQHAGDQEAHALNADENQGDAQYAEEQHITGKPTGAFHTEELIGMTVKHRGLDEDVGEIQDLIIDDKGQVVGAILTTGGFLGLGGQSIGLGWDQLEHTQEDDESVFYVDIEEEALRNAPEYEQD